METKEIKVGDYIRGFKAKVGEFIINDKYIGLIAKVIGVNKNTIHVEFSDGKNWWYEIDQAIEHLVVDYYTLSKIFDSLPKSNKLIDFELKDNINPDHYKSKSKETIERLQDNLTQGEFKGYLKGNILKYLDRYEHKNGVEDLSKANWYLNKLIELEK
jgi:hypothetical protein